MNRQKIAPVSVPADSGRGIALATATNAPNVADTRAQRQTGPRAFQIQNGDEPPFIVHLRGRQRWALEQLIRAGNAGCTPLHNPALRWSGYVHVLRALGIVIETIREEHGGDFPGHHARYVLRSAVALVQEGAAQ